MFVLKDCPLRGRLAQLILFLRDKKTTLSKRVDHKALEPLAIPLAHLKHCSKFHVDEKRSKVRLALTIVRCNLRSKLFNCEEAFILAESRQIGKVKVQVEISLSWQERLLVPEKLSSQIVSLILWMIANVDNFSHIEIIPIFLVHC